MRIYNIGGNISFQRLKWQIGSKGQTRNTLEKLKNINTSFYNSMFEELNKVKNFPEDVYISAKSEEGEAASRYTVTARDRHKNELANITYVTDFFWPDIISSKGMCKESGEFAQCVRDSLDAMNPQRLGLKPSGSVYDDMKALEEV